MRLPREGWIAVLFLAGAGLALSASSCGRTKPAGAGTGGIGGGAAGSSGTGTGGAAGGVGGLLPCLDRPDDLPRPPTNGLPCDLVPPSLAR